MNHLRRKLQSRRGETLAETLCAMVAISLSSVMLATMLSAAAHLNRSAMDEDQKRFDELSAAQLQTASESSTISITPEGESVSDSESSTFSITLYRKEEGALTSFSYIPPSQPPEPEAGEPAP